MKILNNNDHKLICMNNIRLIFLLGLILFSCKDPYEGNQYLAYDLQPAATYMKSRSDFSLWIRMIERAGLYNTLNLSTSYTCFVPTNDAVTAYLEENNLSGVNDISEEDAAVLVKYHTLSSVTLTQSMFTSGVLSYPTATGDYLSLEFRDGGFNSIYVNSKALITELDITVTNGVIHAIDNVLVPITETIYEKLGTGRYGIFKAAIEAVGFRDSLNTISSVIMDNEGNAEIKKYKYTVFAVSDSVYQALGITSLDSLASALGVTSADYTSPDNALNKYVMYHILSQTKSYSDLSDFAEGETSMNLNTLASKELISLTNVSGTLLVNYDKTLNKGIGFVEHDINCKNGVIHEIDGWLPLFTPPSVTVLWDLTDYSDLAAVCTSYQLSTLSSSDYTKEITDGLVTCYTWKSMPATSTGVVYYQNSKISSTVPYSANDHDHLKVTLGIYGWIEMKSPVIIRGKYSVSITYISSVYTSNTGIMLCSMDSKQLGGQVVISNTSKEALKTTTLTSSFEFTETTSHVLRIISIDGKLLTLDCVTFQPVN
jgi:uncharacterized surface protein with fasciclin (FAS1) repeats